MSFILDFYGFRNKRAAFEILKYLLLIKKKGKILCKDIEGIDFPKTTKNREYPLVYFLLIQKGLIKDTESGKKLTKEGKEITKLLKYLLKYKDQIKN